MRNSAIAKENVMAGMSLKIFCSKTGDTVAFELDHLFIFTDIDAPAADCLVSFGLIEGTSNVHPERLCCKDFKVTNELVSFVLL